MKMTMMLVMPQDSESHKQWPVVRDSMSYSRARELVRAALAAIGEDPDRCGVHSLRSGECQ